MSIPALRQSCQWLGSMGRWAVALGNLSSHPGLWLPCLDCPVPLTCWIPHPAPCRQRRAAGVGCRGAVWPDPPGIGGGRGHCRADRQHGGQRRQRARAQQRVWVVGAPVRAGHKGEVAVAGPQGPAGSIAGLSSRGSRGLRGKQATSCIPTCCPMPSPSTALSPSHPTPLSLLPHTGRLLLPQRRLRRAVHAAAAPLPQAPRPRPLPQVLQRCGQRPALLAWLCAVIEQRPAGVSGASLPAQ